MMQNDYCLVSVGRTQVGLVGITEIFAGLKSEKGKTDAELQKVLLEKAEEKNYIPPGARAEYEKALFREFKKFLGEKVEEERGHFLEVTILGPGCYSCNKSEQDVMAVLSETGIRANLNHVSAPNRIAQYGILSTPALIMNGKVKSSGRVPSKPMIKK